MTDGRGESEEHVKGLGCTFPGNCRHLFEQRNNHSRQFNSCIQSTDLWVASRQVDVGSALPAMHDSPFLLLFVSTRRPVIKTASQPLHASFTLPIDQCDEHI